MKIALHRSLSFWAGLLMIGSISWGWWQSLSQVHFVHWSSLSASNGHGGLLLSYVPADRGRELAAGQSKRLQFTLRALPAPFALRGEGGPPASFSNMKKGGPGEETFFAFVREGMAYSPPDTWVLFLPHWTLLLVVVALWAALLVWRARLRKRIIT